MKHNRNRASVADRLTVAFVLAAGAVAIWRFLALGLPAVLPGGSAQVMDIGEFMALAADGHRLGAAGAPVTIVVFSDYGCGHCSRLYESLEVLRRRYPQHLAIVTKHFVEPSFRPSFKVPLGAECAGDQGKFAAYHSAAFANQDKIEYADTWYTLAETVSVPDLPAFRACVETARHADVVARHFAAGRRLGVTGVPTFLINGQKVRGTPSLEELDGMVAMQFPRRATLPRSK